MSVLSLQNITKSYAGNAAVDHIDLDIPPQTIFGLLGPNGAGKTSLIRMVMQILAPDTGTIRFNNQPLTAFHTYQMGYMPEERGLYYKMKVYNHLLYFARLKGLSKKEAHGKLPGWIEKFDLQDWSYHTVEELSKGMQQKVQFIGTVIHEPQLLIFDEPFSGLDPVNVDIIKREIQRLRDEGATIILSTHRMDRVEEICDKIALLHEGQKMVEGPLQGVKQQYKKNDFRVRYNGTLSSDFPTSDQMELRSKNAEECVIHLAEEATSKQLLQELLKEEIDIREFREVLPSLDDIFIETVQEQNPETHA